MSTANEKPMYRADIDGLRALAVSSVVLFHLGFAAVPGGYVGVDVFFVISGFLITAIIHNAVTSSSFSFAAFYERRFRRILPALYAVLTAALVAGWFILLPHDLTIMAKTMASTVGLGANLYFWRTSGYFDAAAEYNALLHTWSLAVEEQFYLFFPILLIAIERYAPRRKRVVIASLLLASFGACVWVMVNRPNAGFYLVPFRAWELLAGSYLVIAEPRRPTARWQVEALCLLGFALLAYPVFAYDKRTFFPGWTAIPPVLGATLLVHCAGVRGTFSNRLLSNKLLVSIGLASYSLYLWHWPVIVLWNYYHELSPPAWSRWALLAASGLLATLSYHTIEKPFRRPTPHLNRERVFALSFVSAVAFFACALFLVHRDGAPARFSPAVVALDKLRTPTIPFLSCMSSKRAAPGQDEPFCRIGAEDKEPSTLLWGDSFLLAWAPALDEVFDRRGASAVFASMSACPPLIDVINPRNMLCTGHAADVLTYLSKHPQIRDVVMTGSWSSYSSPQGQYRLRDRAGRQGNDKVFPVAMQATLSRLRAMHKKVIVLGPTPGGTAEMPLLVALATAHQTPLPAPKSAKQYAAENVEMLLQTRELEKNGQVTFVDVRPWFCDAERCPYESNGTLLYRDGGHLSVYGAMSRASELLDSLTRAGLWELAQE